MEILLELQMFIILKRNEVLPLPVYCGACTVYTCTLPSSGLDSPVMSTDSEPLEIIVMSTDSLELKILISQQISCYGCHQLVELDNREIEEILL